MLSPNAEVMLYVDDVQAELDFWEAIGFVITSSTELMGYRTFTMSPAVGSTATITVFAKEFIAQVSPEVVGNVPSLLFVATDIEAMHAQVCAQTDTASEIHEEPFRNFNFASPSGIYFAVRGDV